MKQKLTLLILALFCTIGAWAETVTWESKSGWTQATGGVGKFYWFGVHTPGDASTTYTLNAIQLMQQTGDNNNDNYLAIARVSATSTLNESHVVAISSNHLSATTSSGSLYTYNFSEDVQLLGGTTYYMIFLSSKTKTNGAYPVQYGRLSLNHKDYGTYDYGISSGNTDWWPYYKATCETSSATGFCTGDLIGGSISGSDNWTNTWTSGTSPSFTLTSSANNINHKNNRTTGGLDIRSGQSESSTYTITAPTGYVITGYKLFGNALTAANTQTITPAEGGSAVGFTGAGNSLCVSGLRKFSTSFVLTGSNSGLFLNAMQVSLASASSITTLPTTNNKSYIITNARATFNFADNATGMSVVTPVNTNLDNIQQQIALIYKNENYYLFSVNANKYLTASNTLTSMPTDNEQVSITATGNATYPWFFSFKNIDDKNINVTGTPALTIDDWSDVDGGNSNAIIEVADFDATQALEMFDVRTVTYNLSFGGSTLDTESDVTVTVGGDPADFVPSRFTNPFVTLSYSPATIAEETTEVTVSATWNGPFQISSSYASAIWQVVSMHTYGSYVSEKWSWSYKSDDSNKVKPEQVLSYDAVTANRLFCFVGNPYDGFKIYNAAAGSDYTLTRAGEEDEISMASGDHIFTLHKSAVNTDPTAYFSLKPSGATNYINYDYTNKAIKGWQDADNGSTCWVVAPGQYYLDFIDGLYLEAPVGAVGTRAYFQNIANVETVKSNISGYRTTVENNMNSSELSTLNTYLDPIKATDVISLANGYYRVISAVSGFNHTAAWYYNPSNDATHIIWAKAATTTEHQINSIFKFEANESNWNIYSPNAQLYITTGNGTWNVQNAALGSAAAVTVNAIGDAQYTLQQSGNAQTLHAGGHSNGSGSNGNLITWNSNGKGEASTWYIVQVNDVDLTLNDGGDGYYYATACLPFDVTLDEACAYTLTLNGAKDGLTLSDAISEVPAGTPVLLRHTADNVTATINTGAAFNDGEPLSCDLTGTYINKDVSSTNSVDYFLGIADTKVGFYHWEGTTLKANRAYFDATKLSTLVKGFVLEFDNNPDAITTPLEDTEDLGIYNLAGQRLGKMQKGINIVNGKKVLF